MDFDHISDVVAQIQKNGTLLDSLQQAQMQLQQAQQDLTKLQEENQKLKVMCDLNIDGSNLTGMKGQQKTSGNIQQVNANVQQASRSGSSNMQSTKPQGAQSAKASTNGSLAEQSAQKANESATPR